MWIRMVEASTLGWTTTFTSNFGEMKAIAVIALGIAILIAAIRIAYNRHLQELGETMTSFGVSAGLIGTVVVGGGAVLGLAVGAVGSPLHELVLAPIGNAAWGMAIGDLLDSALMLGLPMWLWRRRQRHARR